MAWITPVTRSSGFVVTASRWNQDVVDNILVLKTSINDAGTVWSGQVDAVGQNHTFTFGTLNTIGPQILLQSNMTNGSDYMGRFMFGLNTTPIAGMSAKEYSTDTYGIGWHVWNSGGLVERMRLTGDGYLTCLSQPGFLAFGSAGQFNIGTGSAITFDTELYDEAANFAASTFTAPVAGRYLFCVAVEMSNGTTPPTIARIQLVTSNRSYYLDSTHPTGQDHDTLSGSVIADMDASDTASVQISTDGTVHTYGGGSPYATFFSGRLLP